MSRAYCYQCRRAKVACLCGRIEKQPNRIKVIVLQHPDEVSNPKGSAIIAELGLQQYQQWVGEDFSQNDKLNQLITEKKSAIVMLFPDESASVLEQGWVKQQGQLIEYLLVIDASWRKARKIWHINPLLHDLVGVRFAADKMSEYRIRKVPQDGYLSTVEAIVEGLRQLESCADGYQPLLEQFREMIDFQIQKMGKTTYRKHYQKK